MIIKNKPFYKTIVISMFANTENYFIEKSICEQTWSQLFDNSILHLFYTSGCRDKSIKVGNTLYLPCNDTLSDTFCKTLKAIEYIVDNYQFENLIKTNVSTYINSKVMQKMLDWKKVYDNDSIYCNKLHLVNFGFFARGDFTVLNYNHCKTIVEYASQVCNLYNNGIGADDVLMSYAFYLKYGKQAIKLFKTIKHADGISKYDFNKINGVVAIRLKQNAKHSYKDIVRVMQDFDKMIKNEQKDFTFTPIFNEQYITNRIHIDNINPLTYDVAMNLYMDDNRFSQTIMYKNEYQKKLFSLIDPKCYVDHVFICDPKQDITKAKKSWENIGFSYKQNCYTKQPDFYSNFKLNEHHWTTQWCWKNIIPVLYHRLFKKCFPENNFKLVEFKYQSFNLSYHEYINDNSFYFHDFTRNIELNGDQQILRDINENIIDSTATKYHRLFTGFHSIALIRNNIIESDDKLLLNCDSMSIPLIPIFANFFKEILVVDNRTNISYSKLIKDFNATHYVCLMLSTSYYKQNKHISNLK